MGGGGGGALTSWWTVDARPVILTVIWKIISEQNEIFIWMCKNKDYRFWLNSFNWHNTSLHTLKLNATKNCDNSLI